jgi:spermidine synthase
MIRSGNTVRAADGNRGRSPRLTLYLLVLTGGAATMGVEMCASRLLAPYFGNSLPVWGLLIGVLLAYLASGYFIGGRLADRYPSAALLYQLVAWAAFALGLIPLAARPVLHWSVAGFASYQTGAVLGSLAGVLILFALPVALLGCVSPFALRLTVKDMSSSGDAAGHVYALATLGSLIGTFLPVFVLIPTWGTRRTFLAISLSLLITAIAGLAQTARRTAVFYLLLLSVMLLLQLIPVGATKPTEGLLYEKDSAYNYIQVLRNGDELVLKLNEGEGIQSTYHPQQTLTGYVYDYFLLAPLFRSQPPSSPVSSLCLIGLAGGTMATQYTALYGAVPIDGVEIDPAVVEVGRRFFGLNLANLRIFIEDGRYYLARSQTRYDVLIVDAYRPPYIPFQLTTAEFFQAVRDHLADDGVVAVNVARTEEDLALVDAIGRTLQSVYPSVYIIDTQSDLNSIVIATRQPTRLRSITDRIGNLTDATLRLVAARSAGRIREYVPGRGQILTDDRAPVEQMVHAMVLRYLMAQTGAEVRP